jgi:hypothetical protein
MKLKNADLKKNVFSWKMAGIFLPNTLDPVSDPLWDFSHVIETKISQNLNSRAQNHGKWCLHQF